MATLESARRSIFAIGHAEDLDIALRELCNELPARRPRFAQSEFDFEDARRRDRDRLMKGMDAVNHRWGRGSVKLASGRVAEAPTAWGTEQERKSPNYATDWEDMPVARA